MPSSSEAQRRLMGAALAYKRGESKGSPLVRKVANGMNEKQLGDFASKHHSTPMRHHKGK